jgi:cytochrome c-type biogenesis protein CcmH
MKVRLAVCALLLSGTLAFAVTPDEVLKDAGLEQRARAISAELRCLVCQNQSIDDSDASLAKDLRVIVRERLLAGDSDDQIRAFVVARYGEFVLLRPPFGAGTALLWSLPFLAVIGGIVFLVLATRKKRVILQSVEPLNAAELSELERRLDTGNPPINP